MEITKSKSSLRAERKTREKDRRTEMRHLLSVLASVLAPQPSKISALNLVDEAADHVKKMHARIAELEVRKAKAKGNENDNSSYMEDYYNYETATELEPVMDIKIGCNDSYVEVNMISGLFKNFMLHEVIRVLQEAGAEVTSYSSYKVGHRVFYTIKSQALSQRIGIDTLNIHERLNAIVNSTNWLPH
ncbi:transcription factor bHLH168-like [Mercurialis annua]|uniref:transcription factor bHLH168-like n=1 Tax=Mercurialis annua TaxID=3986 RepID=UPI002160734B|nr:transcription factor bHLH168-like [Mercurialis annua]